MPTCFGAGHVSQRAEQALDGEKDAVYVHFESWSLGSCAPWDRLVSNACARALPALAPTAASLDGWQPVSARMHRHAR
jgi:hypothetical protein